MSQAKKLVLVLATSMSITDTSKKTEKVKLLDRVFSIYYPVKFQNDKGKDVLAFLNFKNKINAITLAYIVQLGFKVRKTDFGTQKIDGSSLKTYGMVIAAFQVFDKLGCSCFF